ncbi:peptidoglycan DD-metalloendopeptidase family protein [Massilia horti]|uniref:LysM peptidoglycan-binding domain-containing protein n=1 Tax=Massilia horti TaxID=2562153 RepID=A0A4Y9SPU4_9BURK|nr:peptidoglycan DD-metalloendopeptidase family protein [Massilia horti]TFW28591.1 LysM peptidoglycan-binding domain-containing protein [Massilia horti]
MKQNYRLALLTMTLGLLGACTSTGRQAPVAERPVTTAKPSPRPVTPPPVVTEAPKQEAPGTYTVKKGDTLLRIALDHGQSYRDLVTWNNLSDPDDIKVGQALRVVPPDRAAGVQTMPVPMPDRGAAPVPRKVVPKGEKRPYTEGNVAETSTPVKPETSVTPVAPSVTPVAPVTPGAAVSAPDEEKLSWMWPSDGKIIATFDEGKNKGIDIAGKLGQQVLAAGAGKVMYAGSGIRGYGNLVIVKHNNSLLSAYAHNRTILVKEGQTVSKGQAIAEMGDSDADSVKLHFEIRQQGKPVDPSRFLPSR